MDHGDCMVSGNDQNMISSSKS